MRLIYHKCRRLLADIGEFEYLAWDVMRKCFYIDLSYCKEKKIFHNPFHCRYKKLVISIMAYFFLHCHPYSALYILFLEAVTENYSLK